MATWLNGEMIARAKDQTTQTLITSMAKIAAGNWQAGVLLSVHVQ